MATHFKRLILSIFLVASLVGFFNTQTALAAPISGITTQADCTKDDPNNTWVPDQNDPNKGTCEASSPKTSCAVDGVGWIVCPITKFLGTLNDAAYSFISGWLSVPPGVFTNPGALNAWSQFRNIANVAFVIAFLVIIYSQLTSAGVSNYGIKRLLPRLIITAILVNVSFYLCAIAVDVSNIVGSSIKAYFESIPINDQHAKDLLEADNTWDNAVSGLLTVGAAIGLIVVLIFAPGAFLAFALIILILVARQAFVILLVVLSPLAFVAYLLPNTENLFTKWRKSLTAMLLVFPIVGAVFGVSKLASEILIVAAQSSNADGSDDKTLGIMAAGVLAIPLFAVPALLKGAMAGAGTIGAKLSGLSDKATGRAKGQFGAKTEGYKNAIKKRKAQQEAFTRAGKYRGINPVNRVKSRAYRHVANPLVESAKSGKVGATLDKIPLIGGAVKGSVLLDYSGKRANADRGVEIAQTREKAEEFRYTRKDRDGNDITHEQNYAETREAYEKAHNTYGRDSREAQDARIKFNAAAAAMRVEYSADDAERVISYYGGDPVPPIRNGVVAPVTRPPTGAPGSSGGTTPDYAPGNVAPPAGGGGGGNSGTSTGAI